jgi:acetyl esterase/lipase
MPVSLAKRSTLVSGGFCRLIPGSLSGFCWAVFLGHGLGDFLVGYLQSTNFASWLAKQGLEVELHLYPYYSHAFNHPGITDLFPKLMDEVEHFLQIHL